MDTWRGWGQEGRLLVQSPASQPRPAVHPHLCNHTYRCFFAFLRHVCSSSLAIVHVYNGCRTCKCTYIWHAAFVQSVVIRYATYVDTASVGIALHSSTCNVLHIIDSFHILLFATSTSCVLQQAHSCVALPRGHSVHVYVLVLCLCLPAARLLTVNKRTLLCFERGIRTQSVFVLQAMQQESILTLHMSTMIHG